MKNYFSNLIKIRKHKRCHENWFNCFDPYSNDVTINGTLSRDQLWERELPNQKNTETIFIYGTNSKRQALTFKFNKIPVNHNNSDGVDHYQYSYSIFLDCQNGNYYSADETRVKCNNSNKDSYQLSGLLLQVLEPFQKWRIKFVGYLRDKNKDLVFVRMRLLWVSNSEVFDFKSNCNTNYLAKQLSVSGVGIDCVFEDRYVGCGQLKGTIQLDNEKEEEIYLWGSRSKAITCNDKSNEDFEKSVIMAYSEKGIAFEINKINARQNKSCCIYGFGSTAQGLVYPIEDFKVNTHELVDDYSLFPKSFSYKANGKYVTIENLEISSNRICHLNINGHRGSGVLIENIKSNQVIDIEPHLCSPKLDTKESSEELVLRFEDESAFNQTITGGKGSSLSILNSLSKHQKSDFVVPKGLIVTTNSYDLLLRENPELESAIHRLEEISWSKNRENLPSECSNLASMFTTIKMPSLVKQSIRDALKCTDENLNNEETLYAVRSSACGEDSEDMSAAGQMTTYLGIKGLDEICNCVMKCWSSQFSITAVEYKHGYGQRINTPMAVVIQEMVDCDVAGVMFTCDPINGDPGKILITSNYGIGESVVSASVNPDNITLSVNLESNSFSNKRSIKSIDNISVGAKETSISINKSSGFGTEVKSSDKVKGECSLSESEALKLGEIGLSIDWYFESARDIEWGIKEGILYLFQCRPVTNLNNYTEWELMHELDTGHSDETEYNTRANVGEVMPGALSHLFLTTLFREMCNNVNQSTMKLNGINACPYRRICHSFLIHCNSVFFNMKDSGAFQFAPEGQESVFHKAMVLALFGHPVEDERLREDCFNRYGKQSLKDKLIVQKATIGHLTSAKSKLHTTMRKYQNIDLLNGQDFNSTSEMIDLLLNRLHIISECIGRHFGVTIKSSVYNLLLLLILSNGNIDVNSNPFLLNDFANVLSSTGQNIVSADVPTAIKKLAQSISESEVFCKLSPEQALQWLQTNEEQSGKLYKKFLEVHGHRGYKEFDLMSNTWIDTPLLLVKTVQTMLPITQKQSEQSSSDDDILSKIKTPLSRKNRILLKKWIIPACHQSISDREEAKSFLIKTVDKFRQFFREFGKMMSYKEGRIPEPDLIYYMTLHELIRLTKFRDPKIVAKAKQRKKIFPKFDKFIYDELLIGPQMRPRNLVDNNLLKQKYLNGPNCIIKGTPVSVGSVRARVCVAKTFDESKQIQPGDILVTYSTDIGWSPYFPMISGIITEIGGLVSHGAVIAREYGLPCLVGVDNACRLLSTGDTVLLDADNGQIVLIRISEN